MYIYFVFYDFYQFIAQLKVKQAVLLFVLICFNPMFITCFDRLLDWQIPRTKLIARPDQQVPINFSWKMKTGNLEESKICTAVH